MQPDTNPISVDSIQHFVEDLLDRCRTGELSLAAALSVLEGRLERSAWKGARTDEIRMCCAIARVSLASGAHHVARRAIARGRARLHPTMPRGLALLLRVLEIELHGLVGNETQSANELVEVLRDLSDPDCHLAQLSAFRALMRLLLDSDSLKSAQTLNEWMAGRALEQSGFLGRAQFFFLLWSNYVEHRRCELAHPYYKDSLLHGARDEGPVPFKEALARLERATAALVQGDRLLKNFPREVTPLTFTMSTLRDAAVQSLYLMRGDPGAESCYVKHFEEALSSGNIIIAAQAAEAVTPYMIDSGRASVAAGYFNRIKQTHGELPPMAARRVEYGLYKTAEATGHANVALAAYRRYVVAVRSLITQPMGSRGYVISINEAPSLQLSTVSSAPLYVRQAIEIMQQRLSDRDFSLDQLAQMVGISDRTLRSAFSLHVGSSPLTYLRNLRLEAARLRFEDEKACGGLRVQSIARECGFDHPGRFAKAFAERYGCSPREYARR